MVTNGSDEHFEDWWDGKMGAMVRGDQLTFAVRSLRTGVVVGTTGYHSFDPGHRRVEIGSTYYRADVRGTKLNAEAKLLLLDHAFSMGAARVEFVTDALNERSQTALERLGATREGVLRCHKITWTGRLRDTVVYSIVHTEWPEVRSRLQRRLDEGLTPRLRKVGS